MRGSDNGLINRGRQPVQRQNDYQQAAQRRAELAARRANEELKAKRKRSRRIKIVVALILIALAIYGIAFLRNTARDNLALSAAPAGALKTDKALTELEDYPVYADARGISSKCVLLAELDGGRVICEKNAAQTVKIASLTKIMTAIVAIENIPDLKAEYTMSASVINYLKSENASVAGFEAGERVTGYDLLYAAMLPSGGDGAMGLADMTAGSQDAFVDMMNQKAKELGMNRTHFTNATGFDDDGNYSCAYDVSLMFEYALENELFRTVATTDHYTSNPTPYHPNGIDMKSTVYSGFRDNGIDMGCVVGGKTGYTWDAGRCLATYAERGGKRYILVTLGAGNTPAHFVDAFKIYSEYLG